jgi:two-component system chemotaxis response regulator CheB
VVTYDIVAMGASWGGLHAVETVLGGLPDGFRTPIAIAQHRAVDSASGALARLLSLRSGLEVREVGDKDAIEPGGVYLAPPDYHLLVESGGFALSIEEHVQHSRPSIDVLFDSAADTYGERVIGVVLTGANEDGAYGVRRIRRRGGVTIAQDPATAERGYMPAAAIATGAVDHVLPLEQIGPKLGELVAA